MSRLTTRRRIERIDLARGTRVAKTDSLAGEEPLEIRVGGQPLTVTMRTPGHDVELVHGFLLSEGVIGSREDLMTARYCDGSVTIEETGVAANTYNVLDVELTTDAALRAAQAVRSFGTTSSCGVCGSASIDDVERQSHFPVAAGKPVVDAQLVTRLPHLLREQQKVFGKTGGLHGAGLFDVESSTLLVREDVGRHNAADKVIGAAVMEGRLPLATGVLVLSGRVSFELVQKAAMAGIGMAGAGAAPSSLAGALGGRLGITVAAFVRGESFNLYTPPDRVV
ncbi:formate dehydrogenase accessory sulfurtransferase FdhD [Blastococcus sp. Marseille-P5729]|uniref:formate dehydrogenase accessory sulfurtransferase FdhD n=1 Tax=Blastococcus sp. Marseille-P5729 TaxID=2086582 RepID=UPI000D0E76AF|nr:formate dehydrogenase accessory sulfurtransferase FdhD [Blastococcus sp. Marseille-P5729]